MWNSIISQGFLRTLSHSLGQKTKEGRSFTQSQLPSSDWNSLRQLRTSRKTPCLGNVKFFCKWLLESGSYSDSLNNKANISIWRDTSEDFWFNVLAANLFSSSSILTSCQQCTDTEGGVLQLLLPVPTETGEKVAYYSPEIFLILTHNNTNWIYYFSRTGTALVTCRRFFLTYAKKNQNQTFSFLTFTLRNINFTIPLKHRHRHESLSRQSSCYTSASQMNCTQTHTIFHTYLKVAYISFVGSSVLKPISVHKFHRFNIKTQYKYESGRPFNWYFNYWLSILIKETQHLDFTLFS